MTDDAQPGSDQELEDLLASLPVAWANLPVDQDGEILAAAYMRAAYGRGYIKALTERVPA